MQLSEGTAQHLFRIRLGYGAIVLIMAIFLVRLFYLQVIRHDYYQSSALQGQFKEYQIPAKRGIIEAYNGENRVPIVLNEVKYTLFADPIYVKDKAAAANQLHSVLGISEADIKANLDTESRYVVLAKKLDKATKDKIEKMDLKGIGLREQSYRTYPQGEMAASLLGFVNDDGEGKYGIEQALNKQLSGKPGQLKAITDVRGVPLISNKDNIVEEPQEGKRVVLTIDMSLQQQLEDILKNGLKTAQADSGGVFIMEADSGAIKAMANYPTYNPSEFFKVQDANVFNNTNVSAPLEIGSVMKPLTMAAALNTGAVKKDSVFYDPGVMTVDDAKITNVEKSEGSVNRSMADILRLSLNTGATWLLMQMGDGHINSKARDTWHDYMVNKYRFSKLTNIEQGYEAPGVIPDPEDGFGLNIRYANSAFGQGMTATPVQAGAALASVINGGTYYRPRLVDRYIDEKGQAEIKQADVVQSAVVSAQTSRDVRELMENVMQANHRVYNFELRPNYSIGGKTGTAEVAKPEGGYYDDRYNGTFTGFVGGDKPQYVVVVRVNQPRIPGYAGSKAAAPIFSATANMLIDNYNVLPKSN